MHGTNMFSLITVFTIVLRVIFSGTTVSGTAISTTSVKPTSTAFSTKVKDVHISSTTYDYESNYTDTSTLITFSTTNSYSTNDTTMPTESITTDDLSSETSTTTIPVEATQPPAPETSRPPDVNTEPVNRNDSEAYYRKWKGELPVIVEGYGLIGPLGSNIGTKYRIPRDSEVKRVVRVNVPVNCILLIGASDVKGKLAGHTIVVTSFGDLGANITQYSSNPARYSGKMSSSRAGIDKEVALSFIRPNNTLYIKATKTSLTVYGMTDKLRISVPRSAKWFTVQFNQTGRRFPFFDGYSQLDENVNRLSRADDYVQAIGAGSLYKREQFFDSTDFVSNNIKAIICNAAVVVCLLFWNYAAPLLCTYTIDTEQTVIVSPTSGGTTNNEITPIRSQTKIEVVL